MGLLDILNGMQNGPRGEQTPGKGGMSPITMAILALLAYKAVKGVTGGQAETAPTAPGGGARPGQIPDQTNANAGGGGLGDLLGGGLGDIFKGGAGAGSPGGGGLGGMLGGTLGGLLAGGAAGSVLSGGLNDLLKQFQQAGKEDVAKSWVGTGPNQSIEPDDLGKALGSDQINALMAQSGLSRSELLQGLSQQLPDVINQLTPEGRLPTEHELSRSI
jgi:uncharacterized protein YidB (DUF937 family)